MDLAGISGSKQAELYGVGALCGFVSGAYRTFQTVYGVLRSSRGPSPEDHPQRNGPLIVDVLLASQLASRLRARSSSPQVLRVPAMISIPMAGPSKYSPTPQAPNKSTRALNTETAKHPSDT